MFIIKYKIQKQFKLNVRAIRLADIKIVFFLLECLSHKYWQLERSKRRLKYNFCNNEEMLI